MSRNLKLTVARKRALAVLLDADEAGRVAWVSNHTVEQTDRADAKVYWQSTDWLIGEGLVAHSAASGVLTLTDAGRQAAQAVAS